MLFLFTSSASHSKRRRTFMMFLLEHYPSLVNPKPRLRKINFNEIPEHEFYNRYRFTKEQIEELVIVLEISNPFELENSCKIDPRVALCILLDKLASPTTNVKLEYFYQIHHTNISRIINKMLEYLDSRFGYTLKINKCNIIRNAANYATAIYNAGAPLDNCIGFIDGTCRQMCRPSRNQRQFYNGHKRYKSFYLGIIV